GPRRFLTRMAFAHWRGGARPAARAGWLFISAQPRTRTLPWEGTDHPHGPLLGGLCRFVGYLHAHEALVLARSHQRRNVELDLPGGTNPGGRFVCCLRHARPGFWEWFFPLLLLSSFMHFVEMGHGHFIALTGSNRSF